MRYLLFDLDNTLYPRDSGVMQRISQRITEYMIQRMGMSLDHAEELRRAYWPRYGTTLRGLQTHHNVDPDDYLQFVHDFALEDYLGPDIALDRALGQVVGEKAIFTNATQEHTQRVLEILGVAHHFCRVFDIRFLEYISKPDERAYHRVLEALEAHPEECVIIEDSVANLRPAKAMGMTTVLVDSSHHPPEADFTIASVHRLTDILK